MSFSRLLYHLVFAPKERRPLLSPPAQKEVYVLLYRQIIRHKGKVYRIGGTFDHVHMLISLPPDARITEVVKILKQKSSKTIRETGLIPSWEGWQEGYGIFSVSYSQKDAVIDYIRRQPEHHLHQNYVDEYRRLLTLNGFTPEEMKYMG